MVCPQFSPSESDGNHSSDDEASPMDEAPAKPDKAREVASVAAPLISLSDVHTDTRSQLILNGSASLLSGSQSLLLNGNPLLSGAGVIINGLSLGDSQTVTLSPTVSEPLIVNGAQVIAKSGMGPQLRRDVAGNSAGSPSVISTSVPRKADGSDAAVEFIPDSDSSASSPCSSSSSSNAIPSLVLTSSSSSSSVSPATPTSAAGHVEYVVLTPADSQPNSVISSCSSSAQIFSLPQVVPSIQGIPVSQLVSSGTPGSQCPQLVPVAPLGSPATRFQSQALHTAGRLVQQPPQQQLLAGLSENGTTTIVSISPVNCGSENQASITAPGKIQVPQVISISSPTQVVPAPQAKGPTAGHLVSLSMPQLVPASPIQTSSSVSFPQVVPAAPSLSVPSAGVPLQILTSGATQAPVKINQLRSLQTVAPTAAVAPGVQLLNSGIIQLPPSSPGTQQCCLQAGARIPHDKQICIS